MEKFLIITSREYLNKITNKTFILSTLFTPLILVGLIFLIGWFASVNNDQVNNVSVVDKSGYIFDKLESTESIKYIQLEDFDLALLAKKSEGFSGAEIEQAIVEGMLIAFNEKREFNTADIVGGLKQIIPLSQIEPERTKQLQDWAISGRVRLAA